jgi:integrase
MYCRSGPATLGEYARDYGLLHDCRPETLRQYRITAKLYEQWAGGPARLDELDTQSVSAWLRDYAATVKPYTVRSKKAQILGLWRAAADEGLCDPPGRRIRSVRCAKPVVQAWTLEEVEQLLAACRKLPRWHLCGLRRSVWWDLAIRFAWDAGVRWGDQMNFPVAAIRPDGFASWTQSKTGRVVTFRLSPGTMDALRLSLDVCQRDLVTPWPASRETFLDQLDRLVLKAGIRPGTWKWIRRSSATDVELQQSGAATAQLGHAPGSRIAYDSYVDASIVARARTFPRPLAVDLPAVRPAAATDR